MTMKRIVFFSSVFLLICNVSVFPVLDFNFGVSSYYIWRGFDLNPSRELMVNPYANLALGGSGLSVTAWGSFAFDEKEMRELDLTLTYAFKPLPQVLVKVGYTEYKFYHVPDPYLKTDSREVFLSAGLPWALLQPEISAYYDLGPGDGLYFNFRIQHTLPILKFIRLELYSSIGYNAGQWLPAGARSGFSDFNFTALLPVKIGRIYLIPFTSYTAVLLDSISNSRYFWYGITFGY
jgi:hypothetical protein